MLIVYLDPSRIRQVFDNCRTYNPPTSVYAKSANRLERFVKDSLPAWKQQAGIL